MKPKILVILESIVSKMDVNGNRYWAFRFTDTITGKQSCGTVQGGEANVHYIVSHAGLNIPWENVYYYKTEVNKRYFRQITKDWKHAGCTAKELRDFINS